MIRLMREKRFPAAFKCYHNFHKAESASSDNLFYKMVIHVHSDSAFRRYQKEMRYFFNLYFPKLQPSFLCWFVQKLRIHILLQFLIEWNFWCFRNKMGLWPLYRGKSRFMFILKIPELCPLWKLIHVQVFRNMFVRIFCSQNWESFCDLWSILLHLICSPWAKSH